MQAGGHEFESRYLHLADKTSVTTKMRTSRTKFSRSWHYMPMLEKALVFRQTSLSHTIVFQSLASLCTLKTAYKYMIRNIKTSEVIVITINLNTFEQNEFKKYLLPTHVTLYMCAKIHSRESELVGYARKSVWWMPWH